MTEAVTVSTLQLTGLFAYMSAGLCMGLGAIGAGIGEGMIAAEATEGCARQPRAAGETVRMMLLGQAMAETAAIFALLVAILLVFNQVPDPVPAKRWVYVVCYLGAGLAMGLSAFGGSIGAAEPARETCAAVARRPSAEKEITPPMLLAAAVAQSTVIYSLVIALILFFLAPDARDTVTLPRLAALLSAGVCMGLGAVGPALGEGYVGGIACREIAYKPELAPLLIRTMLLAQAVSETTGIYSLVISLILIFVVT